MTSILTTWAVFLYDGSPFFPQSRESMPTWRYDTHFDRWRENETVDQAWSTIKRPWESFLPPIKWRGLDKRRLIPAQNEQWFLWRITGMWWMQIAEEKHMSPLFISRYFWDKRGSFLSARRITVTSSHLLNAVCVSIAAKYLYMCLHTIHVSNRFAPYYCAKQ